MTRPVTSRRRIGGGKFRALGACHSEFRNPSRKAWIWGDVRGLNRRWIWRDSRSGQDLAWTRTVSTSGGQRKKETASSYIHLKKERRLQLSRQVAGGFTKPDRK